jgi:hypothetical protein
MLWSALGRETLHGGDHVVSVVWVNRLATAQIKVVFRPYALTGSGS